MIKLDGIYSRFVQTTGLLCSGFWFDQICEFFFISISSLNFQGCWKGAMGYGKDGACRGCPQKKGPGLIDVAKQIGKQVKLHGTLCAWLCLLMHL